MPAYISVTCCGVDDFTFGLKETQEIPFMFFDFMQVKFPCFRKLLIEEYMLSWAIRRANLSDCL